MTPGGWIIMLASVGGTTCLLVWCVYRVIRGSGRDRKLPSIMDEPPDVKADAEPRE